MKFLFLLLLAPVFGFGQKDTAITYTDVVKVDNVAKDELYQRAKRWFAIEYKSSNDVLQLDDKENGEIIGKGSFSVPYFTVSPIILHTVTINIKDGKYMYLLDNFNYLDNQSHSYKLEYLPKRWAGRKKLFSKIDEQSITIINSLKAAMAAKRADW